MITPKVARKKTNVELERQILTEMDRATARTIQALRCMDPKDPDQHIEINGLVRVLEHTSNCRTLVQELIKRKNISAKKARGYKMAFVEQNRTQGKKPIHLKEFLDRYDKFKETCEDKMVPVGVEYTMADGPKIRKGGPL